MSMSINERLFSGKGQPKTAVRAKGPQTIYLNKENFTRFQKHCESQGISASEAIDQWLTEMLEQVDATNNN